METNNELKAEMLAWLHAKLRQNQATEAAGASEAHSSGPLATAGEDSSHTKLSSATSLGEGLPGLREADAAGSHGVSASADLSQDAPIPTVPTPPQEVPGGCSPDPAAEDPRVAAAAAIAATGAAEDGNDGCGAAEDRSYKQQMSFIPWHRTSFRLEDEPSDGDVCGSGAAIGQTEAGGDVKPRPSDITTDRIASVFGEQPGPDEPPEHSTRESAAGSRADFTSEPDALPDAHEVPTALAIAAARAAQKTGHTTAPQQWFPPAPPSAATAMTAEVPAARELLAPAAAASHPTSRPSPGTNSSGMASNGGAVYHGQYPAAGSTTPSALDPLARHVPAPPATPAATGLSGPAITVPQSSNVSTAELPAGMEKLALTPPQQTSAPCSGPSNPASETHHTWPQDGFQAAFLPLQVAPWGLSQQSGQVQVPQSTAGQEPSLPVPLPPEDHSQAHGPGSLTGALSPQGSDASHGSLGSSASALHAAAAGMAAGGGSLPWSGMGWSAASGGPPPGGGTMGWGPVAGGPPPPPPPPPSMAGSAWSATQVPLCRAPLATSALATQALCPVLVQLPTCLWQAQRVFELLGVLCLLSKLHLSPLRLNLGI